MGKKNLPPMGYFIGYRCIYFCYVRSMSIGSLYLFECNHTEFFFLVQTITLNFCLQAPPPPLVSSPQLTLQTQTSKFKLCKHQNSNSHLLSLYIFNRSSGENLLKYQLDSCSVVMSLILMTTLFYEAVILQGEI